MQLATLWKMPMTGKTANDALSRAQLYLRPVFYILFLVIQSEGSSHIWEEVCHQKVKATDYHFWTFLMTLFFKWMNRDV